MNELYTDQHTECTRSSEMEQQALEGFFELNLKDATDFFYEKNYSISDFNSDYDCLVFKKIRFNERTTAKLFFEAKIRNTDYPTLLLEKNKFDKLMAWCKDENCKAYYINFTPKHTVIFNLSFMAKHGILNWVKDKHNRVTVNKELGKIEKEVAYLDIKFGNVFPFVFKPSIKI